VKANGQKNNKRGRQSDGFWTFPDVTDDLTGHALLIQKTMRNDMTKFLDTIRYVTLLLQQVISRDGGWFKTQRERKSGEQESQVRFLISKSTLQTCLEMEIRCSSLIQTAQALLFSKQKWCEFRMTLYRSIAIKQPLRLPRPVKIIPFLDKFFEFCIVDSSRLCFGDFVNQNSCTWVGCENLNGPTCWWSRY
jgi:hypothetical protein